MSSPSAYKRCPYCLSHTMWIKSQTWTVVPEEQCFLDAICDECHKESRWQFLYEESEKINNAKTTTDAS